MSTADSTEKDEETQIDLRFEKVLFTIWLAVILAGIALYAVIGARHG